MTNAETYGPAVDGRDSATTHTDQIENFKSPYQNLDFH